MDMKVTSIIYVVLIVILITLIYYSMNFVIIVCNIADKVT
jgi:hypothetical protein